MRKVIAFILMTVLLMSFTLTVQAGTTGMVCEYGDGFYHVVSVGEWIALPHQLVTKIDPDTGRLAVFYVYYEHRYVRMECSGNPHEHVQYLDQKKKTGERVAYYID